MIDGWINITLNKCTCTVFLDMRFIFSIGILIEKYNYIKLTKSTPIKGSNP